MLLSWELMHAPVSLFSHSSPVSLSPLTPPDSSRDSCLSGTPSENNAFVFPFSPNKLAELSELVELTLCLADG